MAGVEVQGAAMEGMAVGEGGEEGAATVAVVATATVMVGATTVVVMAIVEVVMVVVQVVMVEAGTVAEGPVTTAGSLAILPGTAQLAVQEEEEEEEGEEEVMEEEEEAVAAIEHATVVGSWVTLPETALMPADAAGDSIQGRYIAISTQALLSRRFFVSSCKLKLAALNLSPYMLHHIFLV